MHNMGDYANFWERWSISMFLPLISFAYLSFSNFSCTNTSVSLSAYTEFFIALFY